MYKVMIVDDETITQNLISRYLNEKMPECRITGICRNGSQALENFRLAPADIVLADIRMPIMNGLELIKELNRLSDYYVPIIISSYSEFAYAQKALSLGVINYLLKPVDFSELTCSIESAKRKIDQHRIACSSLDYRLDEQALYLINLLNDNFRDKKTALKYLDSLSFPFDCSNSCGMLVRVNFLETASWNYGKETLHTAVCNLLHYLYSPIYMLPLAYTGTYCDILIFHPDCGSIDLNRLCLHAFRELTIKITAAHVFQFSSIEDLSTHSYHTISANTETSGKKAAEDGKTMIQKAISYINEHYAEDLTRDEVADRVFMSGAYFSRCFKQETGTTYFDYLTEIRMQRAILLLQNNCPIQDVAKKVGYTNTTRFIINFKHYTSYTPSEYRKKLL